MTENFISRFFVNSFLRKLCKYGLYISFALGLALMMHFGDIARRFDNSPEKVAVAIPGPTTGLGDNYYYYTMLRHVPDHFSLSSVRASDPDGGDNRNINPLINAYPGALASGYLFFRTANSFASSPANVALITSILHTTFLAFALLLFLDVLLPENIPKSLIVLAGSVGIVFVDSFAQSVWVGHRYFDMNLLTYYSNTTRMVSPTLYWGFGLFAARYAISVIQSGKLKYVIAFTTFAAVLGVTSLATGATILATLGLYLTADLALTKRLNMKLFPGAIALVIGMAWSYWQIHLFQATPLGQEIATGGFVGFHPNYHCLLALALIPWFWKFGGEKKIFLITLVIVSAFLGFVGESFHLGDRLWLRGSAIFIWGLALYAALQSIMIVLKKGAYLFDSKWLPWGLKFTYILISLGMFLLVYRAQNPVAGSWRNFVQYDKWELIEQIAEHIPEGSIIATIDPEIAYLLPIHTSGKPLFSMLGLTSRSSESELLRYFFASRLYGTGDKALTDLAGVNKEDVYHYDLHLMGPLYTPYSSNKSDAILIMQLVLYHSYNKRFVNVLKNPERHREFVSYLERLYAESAILDYSFDYAIIDKSSANRIPSSKKWPVIYENNSYSLLKRTPSYVTLNQISK
jgi:hypothetical protein